MRLKTSCRAGKHVCAVTCKDVCLSKLAELADPGTTLACDAVMDWRGSAERAASEVHAIPRTMHWLLDILVQLVIRLGACSCAMQQVLHVSASCDAG